jgi:hypothetical protein
MEEELHRLGLKVNHHEENIRFLKSEINAAEESIADLKSKTFCVFATFDLCILGYAFSSFEMDTI